MVVVQPTKKGEKMWTDNLRQFHFWCQKTLPLVYDDSLSYYEVLAKVTKHLNELTTLVNEIGDELERYEGVTDDRLDALETWRTEVDTWRAQIDQWKTIVENWREDVDQWREDIDLWKTSINNWKVAVDAELESLDNRLDTAESDIDSLEGRMDTAESDIDSLDGRLDIAEDDIDTLQSDVTGLDGRLGIVEDDIVSLDGRLDTAEDDITTLGGRVDDDEGDIEDIQDDVTDLQNRMSTAETNLVGLNKALRIINISVNYDQTAQIFKGFCTTLGDDSFIKNNLTSAKISGSSFGYKVRFLMRMADATPYDYSNIYLYDDYGRAIQYEGSDAYLNISHSDDGVFLSSIDAFHIYLLDTDWSDALAYSLPGKNFGQLPRPTNPSSDNGKVVSYNSTLKNYELITPSGGSSHTYSTTEHEVGTWVDGSTVYEQTLTGTWSGDTNTNITIPQGATILELQGFVYRTGSASSQTYYPIYSGDMWIDSDTTQSGVLRTRRTWGSSGTNRFFVTIRYVKKLYRP